MIEGKPGGKRESKPPGQRRFLPPYDALDQKKKPRRSRKRMMAGCQMDRAGETNREEAGNYFNTEGGARLSPSSMSIGSRKAPFVQGLPFSSICS